MMKLLDGYGSTLLLCATLLTAGRCRAAVVVAEGERFVAQDDKGWALTPMDDSYGSHSYGGMWLSHGACLGAPADSVDAVAVQKVTIPEAGAYRVWSKYQAPPYFNYVHKIEIVQNGKTVYSHVYGKSGTDRLWSFSSRSDELWWFWGMDHDAAEAPPTRVTLAKGPAELRVITVPNPAPAGDRMIDFVLLTTNPEDTYEGYKPYRVATPFANEARLATRLFLRFKNTASAAARLTLKRAGHFQPNYGGEALAIPDADVAPGAWSPWVNIGPFCRLVHDEGLWVSLPESGTVAIQIARDAKGKDLAGDLSVPNGEAIVVPVDITWNREHRVMASQDHARWLIDLARTKWRTANQGKKPKELLFYGAFRINADWAAELKDALGYNTQLPDKYEHAPCDGYFQHTHNVAQIRAFAAKLDPQAKKRFRVLSFGDEISLGSINYADPSMQTRFVAWLKTKGVTQANIGMLPDQARLADRAANRRIGWYAQMFNEEQRFAHFREMTQVAKAEIGPHVETGANYSPHIMPQYYGPIYQWVDVFKHDAMTMFWGEDYIFSVPQFPQMISWMMSTVRCATKYHGQKIHMYIMPHAPGQLAPYLRRGMVYAIGAGANHVDNFWVAPAENFTENYIAWNYEDSFRAIHESIYDAAAAEPYQLKGKVRPARVAVVLSKATDHNERNLKLPKANDAFARRCSNAPATIQQIICRVDAQMTYLALKQAGHAVDLITEDDIADGCLAAYQVVYFAGEWIDHRLPPTLDAWVRDGGVFYAAAGCGTMNEFGETDPGLLTLLGLKSATTAKDLACIRPLLELHVATPIDTLSMDGAVVPAIGMRQALVPADAEVIGTWKDGAAAATVRQLGKGKAFAVGTLAGCSYMKTALSPVPWARGGRRAPVNPAAFDPTATRLIRLGVDARPVEEEVTCSNPLVEAIVMDNANGTLVTLANWTDTPVKNLRITVKMPNAPKNVRSIQQDRALKHTTADGAVSFTTDLEWADFIVLPK